MSDILFDIMDMLLDSDINTEFTEKDNCGIYVFNSTDDFNRASDIIEDVVGTFNIQKYPKKLTIKAYPETVSDALIRTRYEDLKEDYKKHNIDESEFKNSLSLLKEYLESNDDESTCHDCDLERLIDFWKNQGFEYAIIWLQPNKIEVKPKDSNQLQDIWEITPTGCLKTYCKTNESVCNEWVDVDDYFSKTNNSTEDLNESKPEYLNETYSKEELHDFINKVYNQQKIVNIYRKKRYGEKRLYAHTRCQSCGREKRVFLSNLVNDPDKYGSCVCSDVNVEAHMDNIEDLYKGTKTLSTNTSGYTGVYYIKKYRGEPYNKWRAFIEIDGKRNYLGDFTSKSRAIKARRAAAQKGLAWYKEHKNEFMVTSRRKHKRYKRNRRSN